MSLTPVEKRMMTDKSGQDIVTELRRISGGSSVVEAEAWAVGQRNGEDVPSTDPTYHNNSKYYALRAESAAIKQPRISSTTENWEVWDATNNAWVDTGVSATGPQGDTGATPNFTVGTVSTGSAGSQASISITGTAENPVLNMTIPRGNKGDKGDTGNTGATGATGATPNLTIGTVTTGAAGSSASVTITGTAEDPVMNMTIPRGDKGDTGNTGATPNITVGTVSTGAAGSSASVTITGTAESPVLNMTIPRGDKGDTGNTGATGATPDLSVGTVSTGAPGSAATVTITGTAEQPVLNMSIPQGAKGDTGNTGATGAVPDIQVGTVTTLEPGSNATVTRRSGSPDTEPVFDFGIPRGGGATLGTTHDTAFYGDYGNTAYVHSVTNKGSAFASGFYKITSNSEGHVTDASAVTLSDLTGLGAAAMTDLTDFYRQFWSSQSSVSVTLDADGKTFLVWSAGSSSGTAGAMMDATYGSLIIVSNGQYAVIHKGSSITVSENGGSLVVTSGSSVRMGVVEL